MHIQKGSNIISMHGNHTDHEIYCYSRILTKLGAVKHAIDQQTVVMILI